MMVGFDDDGQAVNVGREQRCFNRRQRIALGARDGGCRWPGCNRKVSWSEAHHVKFWARDHGKTDLADGILLCRHHHLLLHDEHWEIVRRGGDYWLIPPPDIDASQTPRLMPSKSAALRDLLKENALLEQKRWSSRTLCCTRTWCRGRTPPENSRKSRQGASLSAIWPATKMSIGVVILMLFSWPRTIFTGCPVYSATRSASSLTRWYLSANAPA